MILTATANIVTTISVTAEFHLQQVGNCADATVNVNSNLFDTVASGGTLDIDVVDTTDVDVGTIAGGKVNIANSLIKDSAGSTLYSVRAQQPQTINDSIATLKDSAGNVLSTTNLKAQEAKDIPAPDGVVSRDGVFYANVESGGALNVISAKDLFLVFDFETGDDETYVHEITADSAGTFTSLSQDGASGTITISINGGAYAAFVNPTALANGDTIQVKRTTTAADGFVKLTGTYV